MASLYEILNGAHDGEGMAASTLDGLGTRRRGPDQNRQTDERKSQHHFRHHARPFASARRL
jgi:hypothetical protein